MWGERERENEPKRTRHSKRPGKIKKINFPFEKEDNFCYLHNLSFLVHRDYMHLGIRKVMLG